MVMRMPRHLPNTEYSAPAQSIRICCAGAPYHRVISPRAEAEIKFRSFILLHGKRHPGELGLVEVCRILEYLAHFEKAPLRSIEQSREALQFLYENYLHIRLG